MQDHRDHGSLSAVKIRGIHDLRRAEYALKVVFRTFHGNARRMPASAARGFEQLSREEAFQHLSG
eukprot:COSAG06_NODE_58263_length_277_cov_1.157303_1_plen_64_part_10